jgi:glycosyltransferase involved in cell wall biosynthesis
VNIALLAQAGSAHIRRWSLALTRRGHHVRILSNDQLGDAPPDIPTDFLPGSSPAAYLRNIFRVRRMLESYAPDIVHAHFATGYGLWGSFQTAAPMVLSVWGTDVEDALAHRLTVGSVVRRAFRKARIITAPSRFLLDRAALVEPSIRDRLRLVPFGVEIPKIAIQKADVRSDENIQIIFVKILLPNYAPDLVLDAFAAAVREYPRLSLTMLGGGPMQRALETQAASLGVAAAVTFHDWVDLDESVRRIGRADMMVMPSYKEAFGVAAVEAAACGVPVIATRVGGIPEIVQDGVNGILIPPGDRAALTRAIVRLAADADLRAAMGRAGRNIAEERFDLERNLDQMEALYREVLAAS